MAINAIKENLVLRLELDGGMVGEKQRIKAKSFSKIKTEVADENLYGTAKSLADLQDDGLLAVKRIETTTLINE